MKRHYIFTIWVILIPLVPLSAKVIFVDQNTVCTAGCNGSAWSLAFKDLNQALAIVGEYDEIWVAQGVYYPHTSDRSASFYISKDIKLFGGFQGTETTASERIPNDYRTILSGDIGVSGNVEDNSYTVLITDNLSTSAEIDGFTISDGNANRHDQVEQENGAGWINRADYQLSSNPTLRNCIFENNRADNNGGAFYNDGRLTTCNPTLKQCIFRNNHAKFGGAVFNNANQGTCNPLFLNCQFIRNEVYRSPENKGTGGACYSFTQNNGVGNPVFANCLFWNNEAFNGGAFYALTGTGKANCSFTNCTFYGNGANVGGAIYLNASADGLLNAEVINSILWKSTAGFARHFHFSGNGHPTIALNASIVDADQCLDLSVDPVHIVCNTQQVYFNMDPQFVDPEAGDFHLGDDSPAIDRGNNLALRYLNLEEDFEGDLRSYGGKVDLGMDEYPKPIQHTDIYSHAFRQDASFTDLRILSANQRKKLANFKIFPNPVQDFISIKIDPTYRVAEANYTIFNAAGQRVQAGFLFINNQQAIIQLTDLLPEGMYYIYLQDYPGNIKFVKN